MVGIGLIVLLGIVWLGWLAGLHTYRASRRKKLLAAPFPAKWEQILERGVMLYRHLPSDLKGQLHDDVKIFLGEKKFEGCAGLTITDEMRVTIAAEACLLLLNRPNKDFPTLSAILVYPHPYMAEQRAMMGKQVIFDQTTRAGESWTRGAVVLAWDCVKSEATSAAAQHNVVLHEFAHQLDQEDGHANGAPILGKPSRYAAWARVFSAEYEQLHKDIALHRTSMFDAYGATNPAEFFAVATETFFEQPRALKRTHPELYSQMSEYYRVDPASWMDQPLHAVASQPVSGTTKKPRRET